MSEYKVELEEGSTYYDIIDKNNNKIYWFENERLAHQICLLLNNESKLDQLKKDALELAEFYGGRGNWLHVRENPIKKYGTWSKINGDLERFRDFTKTGGKKAREFLAKYSSNNLTDKSK